MPTAKELKAHFTKPKRWIPETLGAPLFLKELDELLKAVKLEEKERCAGIADNTNDIHSIGASIASDIRKDPS